MVPAPHRTRWFRPPSAGAPAPETYAALLAELSALLDVHEPHEVVVLLRAELERRELRAYSHGWRDAAAHFEPAVEAARTANLRTLRLVGRTPGRAAVIPFRHEDRAGEPRDAEHGDGLPGDADRPHADRHAEGPRGESRPERRSPAATAPTPTGAQDPSPGRPVRRAPGPNPPSYPRAVTPGSRPSPPSRPPAAPAPRRPTEDGRAATPDDRTS
ncbi:hypothetical protein ACN24K_12940 [Streptomyces microflavus]